MESGHYLYVVPTWFKLYRPLDNGWLSECLSAGDLFEYDWIAGRTVVAMAEDERNGG